MRAPEDRLTANPASQATTAAERTRLAARGSAEVAHEVGAQRAAVDRATQQAADLATRLQVERLRRAFLDGDPTATEQAFELALPRLRLVAASQH